MKRLIDILEVPPVLTLQINSQNGKGLIEDTTEKPKSRSNSQAEETKDKESQTEQDEKIKKAYEEYYDVIKAHQGDEIRALIK